MLITLIIFTGVELLKSEIHRTSDINQVVNTIVEALMSSSPRDRYLIGVDAQYSLIWLSRFPAFVADFILRAAFKPPQQRRACLQ